MAASTGQQALHTLFVVSRNGGLVYHKTLSDRAPALTSNDLLTIGATFHSLHAITGQLAPEEAAGVKSLIASTFQLECLESPTGLKFFVTAAKGTECLATLLQDVYLLYSKFVAMNPFQAQDNVIKCSLFDKHLDSYLGLQWGGGLGGYRALKSASARK